MKELESLPFFSPLQDKLQDYCDYFLLLDRMKKNLSNKQKLPDIINDIATCKNRGFCTEDFLDLEKKAKALSDWYQKYHSIIENQQKFKLTDILFKFDCNIKALLFSDEVLDTLLTSQLIPFIDKQNLNDLIALQQSIKEYKQKFQGDVHTISNLVDLINEGLVFNIWCYEFEYMFKRLEFDIKWLANSVKLIRNFIKDYKRISIGEEIEEIIEGLVQKKGVDNEIANNSYEFLVKVLNHFDQSNRLKMTQEYEILKDFKKKSDLWSEEAQIVNSFYSFYFYLSFISF